MSLVRKASSRIRQRPPRSDGECMWRPEQEFGMAWFKKRPKESTRGNAIEAKEAQIKRRAAELQTLAGKG